MKWHRVRTEGARTVVIHSILLPFAFVASLAAPLDAAGNRGAQLPRLADLPADTNGNAAVVALGDRLPAVAEAYGTNPEDLRARLVRDHDLRVDRSGRLYYACASLAITGLVDSVNDSASGESLVGPVLGDPQPGPVPVESPPIYHSRPGATKIIYLDFNGGWYGTGYDGAIWGGPFDTYAFDTDGDPMTFSDAEQTAIKRVWQRIAEDYAPFDVNVTTEEPTSGTVGVILFTQNACRNGVNSPATGYGGYAYIDVFGNPYYWPAWVSTDGTAKQESYMAEAGSHEMGHNLGLNHDGKTDGTSYYSGHGSGDTSWGTIMGTGYNRNVSQFSKGEYYLANNMEDDLSDVAGYLSYRVDDHGNTDAAATPLMTIGGSNITCTTPETDPDNTNPNNKGVIERETDVDVFSVVTGAGNICLAARPWISPANTRGGNVDLRLELYDGTGALIASSNPVDRTYASVTATVAAGTFYLHVTSVGVGTPLINPPSGYTAYGSLGQYFVTGTVVSTGIEPVMGVEGLGQAIADGDTIPTSTDGTDFGSKLITLSQDRTFTILNTGATYLNLYGMPRVAFSGAHTGDFSVVSLPAAFVDIGGNTTFTVRFRPTAVGLRTATVSIVNDDSDRNPYDFAIQGTGLPAPEINVQGNGTNILNHDSTPSATDYTDFGNVLTPPGTSVTRTFVIQNLGTDQMTGLAVSVTGPYSAEFAVAALPDASVGVGSNTAFQVRFDPYTPGASGVRTATVSIASNDPDENPFTFAVRGSVTQDVPVATLTPPADITTASETTTTFTVTYLDNAGINVATLNSSDVRVTATNGYNQLATFVSVDNGANGTPRTATYRITAPGGTWGSEDAGTYNIWMEGGQVADTGGNFVPSGLLGYFRCRASISLYWASMDSDPGWTLEGEWAYGTPVGGGGDPTDRKVIGYDITSDGLYLNGMSAQYAKTPAIDCSGYADITLTFRRYLAVKNGDGASIEVSTDGVVWGQVWSGDTITDGAWTPVSYDLSSWAGSRATVYLRWVMGPSSPSKNDFGWNIDDVRVSGSGVADSQAPTVSCLVSNITTGGSSVHTARVTYADNVAVDVSDCDGNDLRVCGPNGYSVLANLVGVDVGGDGSPRTATYQIAAPGGTWGMEDNGTYLVYLLPGAISDTAENHAPAGLIGSFTVAVVSPNGPPVITEGTNVNVTMSEDGSPTAFSLTLNATDSDGDAVTWSIGMSAAHGTVSASGTGVSKAIGYTPSANYNGTDRFMVAAADGRGGLDTIIVNVTINPVNDAPVAVADNITVVQGRSTNRLAGGGTTVLTNDSDVDGNPLTAQLVTGPLCASGFALYSNGTFVYTNNGSSATNDSFAYRATDGSLASTATVWITVQSDFDGDGIPDVTDPDDDNDGMPDTWEIAYGLNPTNASANVDTDGDGVPDYWEYVAGTVPTNKLSVLAIVDLVATNSAMWAVTFPSATARWYRMEFSTNIVVTNLWVAGTNEVAGTGSNITMAESNTAVRGFFRLRVR